MEENTQYNFDSTSLIGFLFKWKKPLLILSLVAAVVSAGVSFLIDNKYKSTVVVFPASTSSVSKALLTQNLSGKHDVMEFGEEEQAEQLLQVLNSDQIRNAIITKYDLMKHYKIDPSEKFVQTKLIKKYEDNISFKRTKFQSVRIDVLDTDPDTAALIANDIAALMDTVMIRMEHERALKGLKIVETEYNDLHAYIRSLEDSMTVLRKLGVHEYEVQIEMYTRALAEALGQGKTAAAKTIEDKLIILADYGSAYVSLRNKLEYEMEKLVLLRGKFKEAKVDATSELPHKFIVNNAFKAEKKSYPIRWLIVVISTICTFLMTVILIIVVENYKKLNLQ